MGKWSYIKAFAHWILGEHDVVGLVGDVADRIFCKGQPHHTLREPVRLEGNDDILFVVRILLQVQIWLQDCGGHVPGPVELTICMYVVIVKYC